MKRALIAAFLLLLPLAASAQTEPDYSAWTQILKSYYDPARGMDYAGLKARDFAAIQKIRQQLARVKPQSLTKKQQLAYWINLYNVSTVATILDKYPVASIRDISTDPIVRLNVFKKENVPAEGTLLSLDIIENERIREGFHDPRIHFAINCAAKSCPPIRTEAYTGANVDAQLDDQVRRFVNANVRVVRDGDELVVHTTKIMDWFGKDFDNWAGGKLAFLRRYMKIDGKVDFEYDDYDWDLNDWHR
jgi:Protein of unknown function, DUF547